MTTTATIQSVPVSEIRIGSTNPRKHFDEAALAELTESIRVHGVLQPILVRPAGADWYELVAGERRFRAATAAELLEIPVTVRDLTDKEVLEIQIAENLQRQDLHPLEEAEGYRLLHEEHGYSVDGLAAKVGKSKRYVYNRMQLCQLPEEARELFLEGKLQASTALLVTQIRVPRLRLEAARDFAGLDPKTGKPPQPRYVGHEPDCEPLTFREALDEMRRTYLTDLRGAPWKLDDAELVPVAGACSICPKRTGAQTDIFGDSAGRADACTDAACFGEKKRAAAARAIAEAQAKGREVLTGKAAREALGYGSNFVKLEDKNWKDPKSQSWEKLLGKKRLAEMTVVVAIDDHGVAKELVDSKAATKKLAEKYDWAKPAKREKLDSGSKSSGDSWKRKELIREGVERETLARVAARMKANEEALTEPQLWSLLANAILSGTLGLDMVAERYLPPMKKGAVFHKFEKLLAELAARMSVRELQVLAIEAALAGCLENGAGWDSTRRSPALDLVHEYFDLDPKQIEKEVRAGIEFAEKAKKEAAKAAKKKAKAKAAKKAAKPAKKPEARKKASPDSEIVEGVCRKCGCTDDDCRQCIEKTGEPCSWVEPDLCSACAEDQ